jgi:hypothetical protein
VTVVQVILVLILVSGLHGLLSDPEDGGITFLYRVPSGLQGVTKELRW